MEQPSMAHERTGESERVGEQSEHPLRGVFAMFARTPRTLASIVRLFAMFATAYHPGRFLGQLGEQAPMVYPGKEKRGRFKASDYVLAAAGMRVTARYSGAAGGLRIAGGVEAAQRA